MDTLNLKPTANPVSQLQNFVRDSLQENQWVKMGAHHTLEIELNNKLTLAKERLRAIDDIG